MVLTSCPACNHPLTADEAAAPFCPACGKPLGGIQTAPKGAEPPTLLEGSPEPLPAGPEVSQAKSRPGCATAYLVFLVILNVVLGLSYLAWGTGVGGTMPNVPGWFLVGLILPCILNLWFAVALLTWRKWGFYGFVAMGVGVFLIKLVAGMPLPFAALVGPVILYLVLQIGGERSTWKQLE